MVLKTPANYFSHKAKSEEQQQQQQKKSSFVYWILTALKDMVLVT